jgi:hypothetical protein
MATNGTIITYQYPILGGTLGCSLTPGASTSWPGLDVSKSTLSWEVVNQNVVTNETTFRWSLQVQALSNDFTSTYTTLVVDELYLRNTAISYDIKTLHYDGDAKMVEVGKTSTVASGTFTVGHNSEGKLSFPLEVKAHMHLGTYDSDTAIEASDIIYIPDITRHAVLTAAPNFTDEDSPTVSYAVPIGMTGHIYIALDGQKEDIAAREVTGQGDLTFEFTDEERAKLWTIQDLGLVTKQVRFYIRSEFDGVVYYEHLARNLTIINYTPSFNTEVWDSNTDVVNRLTGNKYILVKHASNASYTTGASGRKGASIDTQSVKNAETTKYGASGTFEKVTSNEFHFTATDNYGRTSQETMQFSGNYWIEYVKLTCSVSVTEMTADGDVGVTLTGKFFNGTFGKRNNQMRMHYDISKNDNEFEHVDKGYIYPSVSGSDYTYTFTISGLDYMSVYDLVVRVSDEVMVEGAEAQTILASTPIFDWGRTDFNFNVPVNVEGNLTVAGNITAGGKTVPTIQAQGKAGIWTYRTWSDGTAECWGKKDFTVNVTSAWGNMYTSGAIVGSNISFPFGLFAETPIVNASLLVRSAGGILMAPGGAGSNIANMDQTGVYEIARGTSLSNAAYTINYQVIGRWK